MLELEMTENEKLSGQSLKVCDISKSDFLRIEGEVLNRSFTKTIEQDCWSETDESVSIVNVGAYPCSIIYVLDPLNGSIISGHFANPGRHNDDLHNAHLVEYLEKKVYNQDNVSGIVLPTEKEVKELSKKNPGAYYYRFPAMLSRIKALSEDGYNTQMEAYLFGQNYPNTSETKFIFDTKQVAICLEHYQVTSALLEAGIKAFKIFDYRIPGADRFEDTLYLPEQKVIYRYIRTKLI